MVFDDIVLSDDRQFTASIIFKSSEDIITSDMIQSISLSTESSDNDTLTMGVAMSRKVTLNLIRPPKNIDYESSIFAIKIGVKDLNHDFQYIEIGDFYTTDVSTSNDFNTLKIEAMDILSQVSGEYIPSVSINNLNDFYADIQKYLQEHCNIVLKDYNPIHLQDLSNYAFSEFGVAEDSTLNENLQYLAGCIGAVIRATSGSEIEMVWYKDVGITIDSDHQYMSGLSKSSDAEITITSLLSGTKDNPISVGEGKLGEQINFENPYITEQMLTDIYNSVNGSTYMPCEVKWRGNPRLNPGDIVKVEANDGITLYNVPIMEMSLSLSGGCSQTITCNAENETTAALSNNFVSIGDKVEKKYKSLEQAIINATNQISGNSGGYVAIVDTNGDGKPDEILVMDTESVQNAKDIWRWNKNGLGHSSNGYDGPYTTAITQDGSIVATLITSGVLNANLIKAGKIEDTTGNSYWNLDTGELLLSTQKIYINGKDIGVSVDESLQNSENALSNSETAQQQASEAAQTAQTAQDTANAANSAAQNAQTTADTANSAAQAAQETADKANTNASDALNTANVASEQASEASAIASSSQDSVEHAQQEIDNLQQDVSENYVTKTALSSAIEQNYNQIKAEVSTEIKTVKDDTVDTVLKVSGITILNDRVIIGFKVGDSYVASTTFTVDGEIVQEVSGSDFKQITTTEKMAFMQGDTEIATFGVGEFTLQNISRFVTGDFAFYLENDGMSYGRKE